jgi:hypothetical protein
MQQQSPRDFGFLFPGQAELLPSPAQYILLNSAIEGGP